MLSSDIPRRFGARTIHQLFLCRAGWLSSKESCGSSPRRKLTRLNRDDAVLNFVRIFEEPPFGRPRGPRAIAVVRSAVTWTHEEAGLRKPTDRAAQMRAIDGKGLELLSRDAPYPARCVGCLAISWHDVRILERSQPRFAFRKFTDLPKWHP